MIDDPDFSGSKGRIAAHYQACRPVYEALGTVGDYGVTNYVVGNMGWYTREQTSDGWLARAQTFERDGDEIIDALGVDDRTLYAVTSWKDRDAIYAGATSEEKYGHGSGEALAGYGDIVAATCWIDGDLNNKDRRGEFTDDERAGIEHEIERVIEIIADMYGLEAEQIAAFDSGGGFYPWAPAAATLPIRHAYGDMEHMRFVDFSERKTVLGAVWDEVTGRMADHLDRAIAREEFEYIGGDAGTNKNRQSKAPLAIHADHDVVVTPVRDPSGDVDYTPTLVSDVDDELIRRTLGEVNKIVTVSGDMLSAVDPLIRTLFPDRDGYHGDWHERIDMWIRRQQLDALYTRDYQTAIAERRAEEMGLGFDPDAMDETPIATENASIGDAGDIRITTEHDDVLRDLNAISLEEVAEETVVHSWTPSSVDNTRSGWRNFVPDWRTDSGGTSCFIATDDRDRFVDSSNGTKGSGVGGVVEAALYGADAWHPDEGYVSGEKWRRGVQLLRDMGYDIAHEIPEQGSVGPNGVYDQTPRWAIRRVAYLCGHDPSDDIWRSVETGQRVGDTPTHAELYTIATGIETQRSVRSLIFNAVLDQLDEWNIDHGHERRKSQCDTLEGIAREIVIHNYEPA